MFILDPDKLRFDDAMRPVTPIAIPIPKINICGIANPLSYFYFFSNYKSFEILLILVYILNFFIFKIWLAGSKCIFGPGSFDLYSYTSEVPSVGL